MAFEFGGHGQLKGVRGGGSEGGRERGREGVLGRKTYRRFSALSSNGSLDSSEPPEIQGSCNSS